MKIGESCAASERAATAGLLLTNREAMPAASPTIFCTLLSPGSGGAAAVTTSATAAAVSIPFVTLVSCVETAPGQPGAGEAKSAMQWSKGAKRERGIIFLSFLL